jgi:hypothetical protein
MGIHLHCRAFRSAVVTAALLTPAALSAQAIVRGFVYDDSTGKRLADAAVMLVDAATDAAVVNTKTDSLGQFVLETRRGLYQIAAVREGYNSVLSAPVQLADGERLMIRFPIAMGGDPRNKIGVLEHVKPAAAQARTALDGSAHASAVERRRQVGTGIQFTRVDLEQSRALNVGEFLRRVPGVAVRDGNARDAVQIRRSVGANVGGSRVPSSLTCRVGWFIDGMRMDRPGIPASTEGLSTIRLEELDAIEVFRGISEMPPEFATPDLRCGAIALWTRRG